MEILRIMALESNPPPCLVIGVEPASLEWGLELSDTFQAKMPEMLRVVEDGIVRSADLSTGSGAVEEYVGESMKY